MVDQDLIAVIAKKDFVNSYIGAKKAGDLFYCKEYLACWLEEHGYIEIADEEWQTENDPGYYPDGQPVEKE